MTDSQGRPLCARTFTAKVGDWPDCGPFVCKRPAGHNGKHLDYGEHSLTHDAPWYATSESR